jgi:endoglucanase
MASPNHWVALIQTPFTNETGNPTVPDVIDLTPDLWKVNGQTPTNIYRNSVTYDAKPASGNLFPVSVRHQIYLQRNEQATPGQSYTVDTPYGSKTFTFNERETYCESLKVNQFGYNPNETTRHANLGTYLGTGGGYRWPVAPTYTVWDEANNRTVYAGTAVYNKDDTLVSSGAVTSGEHVYHLDLKLVPEGGPYYISVPNCGRSRSFHVGNKTVRNLSRLAAHGMYVQRCGVALVQPYTQFTRGICHSRIAFTKSPIDAAGNIIGGYGIRVPAGTPTQPMWGGWHDAGNFQIRHVHIRVPQMWMMVYQFFPSHFIDKQDNLPESGNGIPDFLDDIVWGMTVWEKQQITDRTAADFGGVQAGNMEDHQPGYGLESAASSPQTKGTFMVTQWITGNAAGSFAQESRLLRPFDATKANKLLQQAKDAYAFATKGVTATTYEAWLMYAALELYLATGEAGYHTTFKDQVTKMVIQDSAGWPRQYIPQNIAADVQPYHFASYLLPNPPRAVDDTIVTALKTKIMNAAINGGYMGKISANDPYSQGATKFVGWGALTSPFRYVMEASLGLLFTTDPVQKEDFFNQVAGSLNFSLGMNAQGMSFLTGAGTDQPQTPLHLDSYYTKYGASDGITHEHEGFPIGNAWGIMIYGPSAGRSGYPYQRTSTDKLVPAWDLRPVMQRFTQSMYDINENEFTVHETNGQLRAQMGVLYDASRDPNALEGLPTQQPPPPPPPVDAGVPLGDAGPSGCPLPAPGPTYSQQTYQCLNGGWSPSSPMSVVPTCLLQIKPADAGVDAN